MMSAIRDVPERPVPATKTGEGIGMASSQTLSPVPVQAVYSLHRGYGPAPHRRAECVPDGRLAQGSIDLSKPPNAPHALHTDALVSADSVATVASAGTAVNRSSHLRIEPALAERLADGIGVATTRDPDG